MATQPQFPSLYGSDLGHADELNELLEANASDLLRTWARKQETLEKTLEVIAAGRALAEERQHAVVGVIWNVAGYVNTCSFDLAVLGERMMLDRGAPWKRRFYGRHACVLMYEASKDLPALLGKDFREALSALGASAELRDEIGQASRRLSRFHKAHRAQLKDVRVSCAAHRDSDLNEQLRIVYTIQPTLVLGLSTSFDQELNELGPLLQQAIDQANDALARQ